VPSVNFRSLPDHGRLWVFPSSRSLNAQESSEVLKEVDRFLEQWTAHGRELKSGRDLREGRFLLIGVDEAAEVASGCSIDALVKNLRALGAELGVSFVDHAPVWYRNGDRVQSVSRAEFKSMAGKGEVSRQTLVFDTSLTEVRVLRDFGLERPAAETWHGKAFFTDAGNS
jgi:hypothetical protein